MAKNALFPDEVILETEHFKVSQDCEVPIPGFYILAAKRSITSIADFTKDEEKEFAKLLVNVRKAMKEVLHIQEVYLFQNEDSEHKFHLWLFPRHEWMEQFGRKIQSVRLIMDHAEKNMRTAKIQTEVKEAARKMRAALQHS